jgi:hypothetical protein
MTMITTSKVKNQLSMSKSWKILIEVMKMDHWLKFVKPQLNDKCFMLKLSYDYNIDITLTQMM